MVMMHMVVALMVVTVLVSALKYDRAHHIDDKADDGNRNGLLELD